MMRYHGFSGVPQDLVAGANGMLGSQAVQGDKWPYWWEHPRANDQFVQRVASVVMPALDTLTDVVTLEVPSGYRFVLKAILHTFQTGIDGAPAFVDGSGDILWSLTVNAPAGTSASAIAGYTLPDMANMAEQRGSLVNGPWPVMGYSVFDPYTVLRYKVLNVSGPIGAPNYTTCGLFGWWEPAQ